MTKPIPEGHHTITPYLVVDDATTAIDFYERAFDAQEKGRMEGPGGKIAHAEIQIGDSRVMLSDPFEQSSVTPPKKLGGTTAGLFVYVEDVDAVVEQAVKSGATSTMEVQDMFWGDRFGSVTDPFGHSWQIATHKEDLPPEVIEQRGKTAMAGMR